MKLRGIFAGLAVIGGLLFGSAAPAWAEDPVAATDYIVAGSVDETGLLTINATIVFDDGMPSEVVQRISKERPAMDYTEYQFEISNVEVAASGSSIDFGLSNDANDQFAEITIDTAQVTGDSIEISYEVRGAAIETAPGVTEVAWGVLQGLSVPVLQAEGRITVPGAITSIICRAGDPTNPGPCQIWAGGTFAERHPMFENDAVGANGIIELSFTAPASVIAPNQIVVERWTLDRAFSTDPAPLWSALALLVLGGLGLFGLHRSHGRDEVTDRVEPVLVADFVPVGPGQASFKLLEDVSPGEIGTLLDERIDPVDITASLLDLAIRGHLLITELEPDGLHSPIDWKLTRRVCSDETRPFEKTILDAIGSDGDSVLVSELSELVPANVAMLQDQLYTDLVHKGWFVQRPDSTRNFWGRLGWGSVITATVAFVLLVIFTEFGLLGLVLVGLAGGLVLIGQQMPRRTKKGVGLLRGLDVLTMQLHTQPLDQIPAANTYDEISHLLPYAVVLGGWRRWLEALVAADNDPNVPDPEDLSWYHAPANWNLSDLPSGLKAFVITVQGELYGRD